MRIVVLTGGIGGARFLLGVRAHGLQICPDLDSVMYTLAGAADPVRGWGRVGESWVVGEELRAYGMEPSWFGLGDKDIATHLVRTTMLTAGYPLSAVTAALCDRWRPGVPLLPATDDRLETHVLVDLDGGRTAIHFQEWWVRYRGDVPTHRFVFTGADTAKPAADAVLIAPSNPVVSIAPILAVAQLKEAVVEGPAPVVGVSPIISGAPVRGMADRCLQTLGVEVSAAGVGALYGARRNGGLLDGWLVDPDDDGADVPGITIRAAPLWMRDEDATARMVAEALDLAGVS
jgi:LPPG:FO 2-phospho-L-lactate transferase